MKKDKVNNYIDLIKELVIVYIDNLDNISIKEIYKEGYDYNFVVLAKDDILSKLIGKKGINSNSIRNIVKSYAYKNSERVNIEFISY